MSAWTDDELGKITRAEELEVAPARRDGRLGNRVTIWSVRHGDGIYVRSAVRGEKAAWFKGVMATHAGRIWAGGVEKDVTFEEVGTSLDDEVDAAYRSKYRRYAGRILNSCLTPEARSTTLKLVPR